MSWRIALVVLAVALLNALLAFDWFAARVVPPPPPVVTVAPPPPVVSPAPPPPVVSPAPPPPPPVADLPMPEASAQAIEEAAPPGCNVAACEAAYRSFRAADCTYQPFDGPRRLCRK